MEEKVDVIVIGAGIAGTSCAIHLANQGHRVILLDRQEFPRHKTCGEFMSPESSEMLEHLGIDLQEQRISPRIMNKAQIIMPNGGTIEASLPGNAYGISRYELDQLMHHKASEAGVDIFTRAVVTQVKKLNDNCYEVEARQGKEQLRYLAKAVIGAYGTKKPRDAGTASEHKDDTVYVGVKSHYTGLSVPSRVELYFCDGGYVGISPIEGGAANVAALLRLDTVQGSGTSVPEILKSASRSNRRLAERLSEATPTSGTQVSVSPVRLSITPEPWSKFPHIGDAMLMIPPLCGDGMSIALRSAWICSQWTGRYVREEISYSEWEKGYTNDASDEFTQLLKRARRIQKLAFAKTNVLYPYIARLFPGVASYLVKATRLSPLMQ